MSYRQKVIIGDATLSVTAPKELNTFWGAAEARCEAGQPPVNVTVPAYGLQKGEK